MAKLDQHCKLYHCNWSSGLNLDFTCKSYSAIDRANHPVNFMDPCLGCEHHPQGKTTLKPVTTKQQIHVDLRRKKVEKRWGEVYKKFRIHSRETEPAMWASLLENNTFAKVAEMVGTDANTLYFRVNKVGTKYRRGWKRNAERSREKRTSQTN